MDQQTAQAIQADFRAWSGGFPPESEQQIYVYVDVAAPGDTDGQEVRDVLRAWMHMEESASLGD